MKEDNGPSTVIIDLGRQSKKKVKKLRKGSGSLLSDVEAEIARLVEQGIVAKDAQPVIVVVRERQDKPFKSVMSMLS